MKLSDRVFKNKDLTYRTKLMVYNAIVVSTLLYGCETWTLYRRDLKKLEQFHQKKLRSILKISWEDYITNNDVLERAGALSMEATIVKHRLRWSGHVARMEESRLPRRILFGELNTGNRPRGCPLLRYKDQLKKTLKDANIDLNSWEAAANQRPEWRKTIKAGTDVFEANRRANREAKRQRRKDRANQPQPAPTIRCDQCPRSFRAQIGLISHQRAHHPPQLPL